MLPLATRSVRRFVHADALPVVVAVHVDHADETGTVPHAVTRMLDIVTDPIPGLYRITVDTTAVALGARVDVLARAVVSGEARDTEWSWIVGEGEFVDATPPSPSNTLAGLDDDFADGSIDPSWLVNLRSSTIVEGAGFVDIHPANASGPNFSWYGNNVGPSMTKSITGDFSVTADIVLTDDAGSALFPTAPNRFYAGGLIMIDPSGPNVNTFDVSVGMLSNTYALRVQTTDDGFSTYWTAPGGADQPGIANAVDTPAYQVTPGATSVEARLRLSRVGQLVRAEVSFDGGSSWPVDQTVNRAQVAAYDSGLGTPTPLGAALDVGLQANAGFANPVNFRARFPSGIAFQSL